MKPPPNYSVESLYVEHRSTLVGYIHGRVPDLAGNAEDVVQNLFVDLQKRGTVILGDCSLESLKKHARRQAISMIREKNAKKRGGGKVSSLDQALETVGFEPIAAESSYFEMADELEIVDRVISEMLPQLRSRELIILGILRRCAPVELSLEELADELTPLQRLRFMPIRRDASADEIELLILKELSRSKASLRNKLRETFASMSGL